MQCYCRRPSEMSLEDISKKLLRDMKTRVYQCEKPGFGCYMAPGGGGERAPPPRSAISGPNMGAPPTRSYSVLSGFSLDSNADSCAICLSTYKHDEVGVNLRTEF